MSKKFSQLPSLSSVTGTIEFPVVGPGPTSNKTTVGDIRTFMFNNPAFTGTVTGVTAAMVGLGNVTNESKTTMFNNPAFTGTVTGVTASMVGLGNVTNESKATMFANPTFTGTVTGISASMVGLGNVTNESKATMFTNAALTGTPTAPTATAGTNTTQIASTAFVNTAISNLVNAAPTTLDTLNELAAALGNDPDFATTVTNAIGLKAPISNPSFTGTVGMGSFTATNGTINANNSGYSLTVTGAQSSISSRIVNTSETTSYYSSLLVSSGTTNPVTTSVVSTFSTGASNLETTNSDLYLKTNTTNKNIYLTVNGSQNAVKVNGSDRSVILYSATQATSTISGALQVVGGIGVQGQVYAGSLTVAGPTVIQQYTEALTTKTNSTGVVAHDYTTGTVFVHSTIFSNFTANFTNVPTTADKTISFRLVLLQGATPYMVTAVQVDGVAQTINWLNASPPTGTSNRKEAVTFTLLRTGGSWVILANIDSFG